jgi:hypothetical protein
MNEIKILNVRILMVNSQFGQKRGINGFVSELGQYGIKRQNHLFC